MCALIFAVIFIIFSYVVGAVLKKSVSMFFGEKILETIKLLSKKQCGAHDDKVYEYKCLAKIQKEERDRKAMEMEKEIDKVILKHRILSR
ncbi:hypothetical protein [Borreliella turdi]|uniref:hypothetical protein n=1 Tax=Borreliella turdi TaxID=57863 RepID=UPI003AEFCEC4